MEESMATARKTRCPICHKPATAETKPFCSKRCADADLGNWITGRYAVSEPLENADEAHIPDGEED